MNRIIKFRVWDIKHKVMISPIKSSKDIGYVNFDINTSGRITRETLGEGCCGIDRNTTENQENYIIQQSTSLLDKNNKELYEGDIVRVLYNDNPEDIQYELVKISYINGCFWLQDKYPDPLYDFMSNGVVDAEIVGNIFENPELVNE